MSVVHEALKQVKEIGGKSTVISSPLPRRLPKSKPATIAWIAILIAISSLYYREIQTSQRTRTKLQQALLQLNDARIQADQARQMVVAKQQLEYENFEKEKKISRLSKELHELKMSKPQLAS